MAGLHVPATPSLDVVGSVGAVPFRQTEFGTVGKVGTTLSTIVMFRETGPAHWPAPGVNVYRVVPIADVLITAGLHVPVIPSLEVVGSAGAVVFRHIEFATVGKVGATAVTMAIFIETGPAHCPAVGVNV